MFQLIAFARFVPLNQLCYMNLVAFAVLQFYKRAVDQHESDMLFVVHSLLLSIKESDLCTVKNGQCNASCIRHSLVKLLRHSGYDAAVCSSRWQGLDKVPGGNF